MKIANQAKPIRLIAKSTPGGTEGWRFVVVDIESGRILPVSAEDKVIIEYNGGSEPIKATMTILIDEVDMEAIAAILIKSNKGKADEI